MFDAHTHLQDQRLSSVIDDVIRQTARAGITGLCCCGTSPSDWDTLDRISLCSLPFTLVPAFGVHPWYADHLLADWLELLERRLIAHTGAVIGEIGLDGIRKIVPFEKQKAVLVAQLELAVEWNRPVVLHGARAWGQLVEALAPYAHKLPGFIAHGFSSSTEVLRQLLNLGGMISIAGTVCDPKAINLRSAVCEIPDDRILIETDTPDMFPRGGQVAVVDANGRPLNQPANLIYVLRTVAELRHTTPEVLAALTTSNAQRIFKVKV